MIFSTLKTYAIAILTALAAVLGAFASWAYRGKGKAEKEASEAKAKLNRRHEIEDRDNELEAEYRSDVARIRDEVNSEGVSHDLADPNANWLRDGRSNN